MWLILLEALVALLVLIFIVWWTMFSGRKSGERNQPHNDDNSEEDCQSPSTPSTDPYVRSYRIRLLPWVVTIRRWLGYGWQMRGTGSQCAITRCIRRQGR